MNFTRLLIVMMTIFSFMSVAIAGNEGGGGDKLVVEFIQTANNILQDPSIEDHDKNILRKALNESKIVTVLKLKNPITGEDIPNQKTLVAWGSKNFIQLKLSSGIPGESGWDLIKGQGAHFVFHELYRASGLINENGQSPDEAFQLSIGKYRLDRYAAENRGFNCREVDLLLLEAYELKRIFQRYGQETKVKIGSDMFMSNLYGRYQCIYTFVYYFNTKGKHYVWRAVFDADFTRPAPENITEVVDFPQAI